MATPRNLDELKDALYTAFGKAVENASYPYNLHAAPENAKAVAESLKAAADLARSVVEVEREIASRNDKKDGMKMPGK